MKFDVISDIHIDFWIKLKSHNPTKMKKLIDSFVLEILPEEPSDLLIIAGDLGHYNWQNELLLRSLKEHYLFILMVAGNHDFYLDSPSQKVKYEQNSTLRWNEMKGLCEEIDGVHVLEGDTFVHNGVTYGGTGMWYDFSYSMQKQGYSYLDMESEWHQNANDSAMIFGERRNVMDTFYQELTRLESVIDKCDVIITHVSPDASMMAERFKIDSFAGCFYFDGERFFNQIQNKIWIFGHVHDRYSYEKYGCWFINASLGYKSDNRDRLTPKKIVSIDY